MDYLFQPGEVIDKRFKVVRGIGGGGMGRVMLVEDLFTASLPVALKYCLPGDQETTRRFAREVRIMAGIQNPNVMPVLSSAVDHDPPYFVMPLGKNSIAEELDTLSKDEAKALEVFKQICLGIQAIHTAGGTHRDIKPQNAMRMPSGSVVVSDLGLAKLDPRDSTILTKSNVIMGTDAYIAPEQRVLRGTREADARTDVYQLGKVLYELLTDQVPIAMDLKAISAGLAYIIRKATRDSPGDRYPSVPHLLDAVAAYQFANGPGADPARTIEVLMQQAESLLQSNRYERPVVQQILATLPLLQDRPEDFTFWFDKIPNGLLHALASAMSSEFEPVLSLYSDVIDEHVERWPFEYAETVARKMKLVFDSTKSPEIKKLAVRAVLAASVKRWRYAAMDVFDRMLLSAASDADAAAIAETLADNLDLYRQLADRISGTNLHPGLRGIHRQALP
ncbi:serine/threonine-protein kinase [Hyalangium rubrum]|uniref:Serine/threonine-protein kinase n=1 Tax=Hyalangium rubrum TaxID=3103134 RepID=A0ABU5HAW6_9BACT|nr:serine/threonine-protein kinase [Hyalangium sp. s54d21]MDY7230612.1 serine/threonine-protein kinase [Hyalangium sp. s54d21]